MINNNKKNDDVCDKIVIGKIKKFDQTLYDKYDVPARNIVKEKLIEHVSDNPNIYEEDMLLQIPSCKYKFLELQVCARWTEDKYPFDKPFVYARKKLFSDKTLFIIFNKDMSLGLLFDKNSLLDEPKRLRKYSRSFAYEVPWHRVLRFIVDELSVEIIKMYC
jgi:hypothetical protein